LFRRWNFRTHTPGRLPSFRAAIVLAFQFARICILQATQISSQIMNDQLAAEMDRDEKVREGEISEQLARHLAAEWSQVRSLGIFKGRHLLLILSSNEAFAFLYRQREWGRFWPLLKHRVGVGYIKYHAVTIVIRVYEAGASRLCTQQRIDDLTYDTFRIAKQREYQHKHQNVSEMFSVCWNAQLIGYFADYTIHQFLLARAYYLYLRDLHQRRDFARARLAGAAFQGVEVELAQHENVHLMPLPTGGLDNDDRYRSEQGALLISFLKKSTMLALSRAVALACASLGGALGTYFFPGYGTIAGMNIGDGVAFSQLDVSISAP
jgi:hypothetical protein